MTTPSLTSDTSIDHEPLLSLPTVTHEPLVFPAHPQAISLKPLQGGRAKSSMASTSSNDRVAPALNILQSDLMLGSNVPIGACRPTPLTTNQMTVKTYKTAQGQVVVLPSRSLLVDFRERDRRNGNAGDEVLIISADGVRVQVFNAPHLSTPCCLAEPDNMYPLETLPVRYWKSYDRASRVVEHVKKKMAKLSLYQPSATCTLMSNEPCADIEVLFDSTAPYPDSLDRHSAGRSEGNRTAGMRIRLSRKGHILEISTFVSAASGSTGEWKKKILAWISSSSGLSPQDLASLTAQEKEGLDTLAEFVRVAEAFEALGPPLHDFPRNERPSGSMDSSGNLDNLAGRLASLESILDRPLRQKKPCILPSNLHQQQTDDSTSDTSTGATAATESPQALPRSFSDVSVTPRPKLSPPHLRFTNETARRASSTVVDPPVSSNHLRSAHDHPQSAISITPEWQSTSVSGMTVQTRFIPSVGWCIRYGTSAGGRYRIMFLDGVTLEVDVDEEMIKFTSQDGKVVKCVALMISIRSDY